MEGKRSFKIAIFLVLVLGITFLDRITKWFVPFLSQSCYGLLCIRYSINKGAAFGLFSSFAFIIPLLVAIALAVLFVTALFYFKIKKFSLAHVGLALLFAGTLSNLFDRIVFDYVIDWIKPGIFPAFNIADVANVAGVLLLIIALLKK